MNHIPYGKQSITKEDLDAVSKVLVADFITTGPVIKEFEKEISDYCGSKYCVAVSNGTLALHFASLCLLNKNTPS